MKWQSGEHLKTAVKLLAHHNCDSFRVSAHKFSPFYLKTFHWKLNYCIDLNCIGKDLREEMFVEENKISVQGSCVGFDEENDFDYTSHSFVAVGSDSRGVRARFWIEKVVNLLRNWNGREQTYRSLVWNEEIMQSSQCKTPSLILSGTGKCETEVMGWSHLFWRSCSQLLVLKSDRKASDSPSQNASVRDYGSIVSKYGVAPFGTKVNRLMNQAEIFKSIVRF